MKKLSVILVILVILFSGCSNLVGPEVTEPDGLSLVAEGLSADFAARSISSNGVKLAFRSSDIEFWSTEGDYSNLVSVKYVDPESVYYNPNTPTDLNTSVEIALSNTEDNVIFMPNHVNIGNDYNMPNFDVNKIYDIVRMDIGGGNMDLTMNGNPIHASSSSLGSASLNANSIVLVDRSLMSSPHYFPRNADISNYHDGDDYNFLLNFIRNGNNIDVDGALFLPFDSVDFAGKKTVKKIKIKLDWDMDDIFTSVNSDVYTMRDSADGTPYNFDISVEIN